MHQLSSALLIGRRPLQAPGRPSEQLSRQRYLFYSTSFFLSNIRPEAQVIQALIGQTTRVGENAWFAQFTLQVAWLPRIRSWELAANLSILMYNLDRRDLSSTSDQSMAGIPVVGHDAGWVPLNGRSLAAIFAIVPYLRRAGSTTAELCVKLWSDPEQVERQEYHAMDDDILISVGLGSKRRVQAPKDRAPPGQYVTTDFPVLSAGPTPQIKFEDWTFALQRVRRLRFMENDDPGF